MLRYLFYLYTSGIFRHSLPLHLHFIIFDSVKINFSRTVYRTVIQKRAPSAGRGNAGIFRSPFLPECHFQKQDLPKILFPHRPCLSLHEEGHFRHLTIRYPVHAEHRHIRHPIF